MGNFSRIPQSREEANVIAIEQNTEQDTELESEAAITEPEAAPKAAAKAAVEVERKTERKKPVGRSMFDPRTTSGKLVMCVLAVLLVAATAFAYVMGEKQVQLVDGDAAARTVLTRAKTVADLLEQEGIVLAELDEVEPAMDAAVDDESQVVIRRAFNVTVSADFAANAYPTQPQTVADFLAANDIAVGEYDWVSPAKDHVLAKGDSVVINRITYRTTQVKESVAYKTTRKEDSTMNSGKTKVLQAGKVGEKTITNLVTYKDGVAIAKQELSRAVTTQPVDEVIAVGTRRVISRGGKTYEYTKALAVRASAYTHTGHNTATGAKPKAGFTVAVDPSVIPLGTMLYVDGYGYCKAQDTGSAIKGNKIDLFFDSENECLNWGVRTVRVYVLK